MTVQNITIRDKRDITFTIKRVVIVVFVISLFHNTSQPIFTSHAVFGVIFYLMTLSILFIYGYMASDIW